ncbi:similar to Saccharomyces cerevisiae YLR281C Putative protein of unknown function [Maudiozyma barnettii]|uniref:Prokaryotic-type class I peptide chain release factors domain-containing protein n=1 Tax=Maudiozyma barnettii TaxID=61262 RepID=A0A8H2ZL71_9SACH|nr:Rso55p [Kazachstania barnettii]CAB4255862.1 similar to Saccharomyces cerevisiae YLR281C Putative protein of unknown function [Kazachstania barnettii]CAD1784422.1 similar to Saccharomyces cerevisiae YLR281C Putative protein of unknown function [Kazachstania barnettii]
MYSYIRRSLTSNAILRVKRNHLPPRPKFTAQMENDCTEVFIHGGSGAGGQKINKTNSKVQLKHIPTGIVVTSQITRSRDQNRKDARERMAYELAKLSTANGSNETPRDIALRQLKQQNKKAKLKKSSKKYEVHKEEKERLEESQRLEDESILGKMLKN